VPNCQLYTLAISIELLTLPPGVSSFVQCLSRLVVLNYCMLYLFITSDKTVVYYHCCWVLDIFVDTCQCRI